MKKTIFLTILLVTVVMVMFIVWKHTASAQVPPGVKVDSIAPATDWTNVFPMRAHSYVADPKTGKLAFIAGRAGTGGNPFWLFSNDYGVTWSSLTGFLPAGAGRTAIAVDSNFTAYIAYRLALPAGAIGIFFDISPSGDGTDLGLLGPPVLVNDTSAASANRTPNYPDIAVSPDGKHIIITAIRFNAMDIATAYVSHDSGKTWKTRLIVDTKAASVKPKAHNPELMWYGPSLAMGSNGYAFYINSANYDSAGQYTPYWEIFTETTDYGETWSTPGWVPLPPESEYKPGTHFWMYGQAVAIGNVPHFADRMVKPGGQDEVVEFHKEGGKWVYHAVSHFDPITSSYDQGELGSLGVDSKGRLYCFYVDRNKSALPPYDTRQVFVAGSSDGGNTWTPPVRLTDKEPIVVGTADNPHWPHMTRFPPLVPDVVPGIFINGITPGLFGAGAPVITAWVQARFPLSVVWTGPYDKDTRAPKPGGYSIVAKGAPAYKWVEVSGIGTKVTGWYNESPAFGDTARDDGSAGPFPIGFDFSFYGKTYNKFWVGANALASFTDSVLNTAATSPNPKQTKGFFDPSYNFPGPGNPFHTVIAAFYNDLDLTPHPLYGTGHGDVYYWTNAVKDTCVIEWYQAGDFNAADDTTNTFEIILAKKDNSVSIMFKDVGKTGLEKTAKVGIQAVDTIGVYYTVGSYPPENIPANNTGVKFAAAAPQEWLVQTNPSPSWIYAIKAVDQNVVWASADTGTVLRTTDGGTTWVKKTVDTRYGIMNSIDAVDANTAWVTGVISGNGGDCKLWKTTDGGNTWTVQIASTVPGSYFDAVRFYDANIGGFVGDPEDGYFRIEVTTNGGATWTRIPQANIPPPLSTSEYILTNNLFLLGFNAWFGTGGGTGLTRVIRTTNGGLNWTAGPVINGLGSNLYGTAFANSTMGWEVGSNGKVVMTTDGGATWGSPITTGATRGRQAQYLGGKTVVFVGDAGKFFVSTDLGATWTTKTLPVNVRFNAVSFVSGSLGWIAGENGAILKYVGGTLVSVDENQNGIVPQTFALWQNYPNPFNPTTTINYDLPKSARITLKVYNIVGQEVATLVDGQQSAGRYSVQFNASHLASGIYFYRLQSGDFVQTNKMVLVK